MDKIKHLLLKACCMAFLFSLAFPLSGLAQVELQITRYNGQEESFFVNENGKLYFDEAELWIDDGNLTLTNISLSAIRKITLSEKKETSINDYQVANPVSIIAYPNPAEDYIRIKSSSDNIMNIAIFSMNGKMLWKGTSQSEEAIDISSLSPGLYIIRIDQKAIKFSKL